MQIVSFEAAFELYTPIHEEIQKLEKHLQLRYYYEQGFAIYEKDLGKLEIGPLGGLIKVIEEVYGKDSPYMEPYTRCLII